MVIYDQLRISDDGRKMYINVHVNKAEGFADRYLDYMVIKTATQVMETEISPSASDGENVCVKHFEGNQKKADLVLSPVDFNVNFSKTDFTSDLFFVYFVCKDEQPDPCVPCPLAELTTLGVTFDENILYQKVMNYTKELIKSCDTPVGFTDFILQWNAFKAAVETEHYIPAIKFWQILFDDGGGTSSAYGIHKPCGCHG